MKELKDEQITKDLIKELAHINFNEKINLIDYDSITVNEYENFIELRKEAKYERDENLQYQLVREETLRQFKKDSVSGIFVEI